MTLHAERTLLVDPDDVWCYHLASEGSNALCGHEGMTTLRPETIWGFKTRYEEQFCGKCEAISRGIRGRH